MMKLSIAVVAAALVAAGGAASARTVSYAVAIGNNAPPSDAAGALEVLRYADDDAVRYHQLFSRFADDARLLTVMDGDTQRRYPGLGAAARAPTLANLMQVVTEYATRMAADLARGDQPVLYLAFSGHGTRSHAGEAFLVLLDARLTQDVLYEQVLAKLPASYTHLIVDACHAAAVVGVRGDGMFDKELNATQAPVSPSELLAIAERTQDRHPTVGALIATTVGQEAHEWSRLEAGVFSHEVISGLLGAADVNGDARIEYSELQAFIAAANRGVKDPRAVLQVLARPPRINHSAPLVVLDQLRDAIVLSGQARALGHFFIELENGQRYLDANLAGESPAVLVLPAQTTMFVRTDQLEAQIPPRARGTLSLQALAFRPREVSTRGSIDAAFRAALFALPYGPTYYRGFVDSAQVPSVSFVEPGPPARARVGATGNRRVALGLAALACASAIVSITTGALAVGARSDFEHTQTQRGAAEADDRYERYTALSITGAAIAAASAVGAWVVWPRTTTTLAVAPVAGEHGRGAVLAWGGRW